MDPTLHTPRLKLTLITSAERGSEELNWLHELRSNVQSTAWSIYAPSTSLAETEKIVGTYLPSAGASHRIAYAVHTLQPDKSTRFIGLVNLLPVEKGNLVLPPPVLFPNATLSNPSTGASSATGVTDKEKEKEKDKDKEQNTLTVELAYSFLPPAWGRGYATEALTAVLTACRSAAGAGFWQPWARVWMRVLVNGRNGASQNVMDKLARWGVQRRGIFEWKGERIFIGGEWMTEDDLVIYGGWLKE